MSAASPTTQFLAAVIVHDDIIAEGTASSVRFARVKACEEAWKVLSGLNPGEFRRRWACDCDDVDEGSEMEAAIQAAEDIKGGRMT